MDVDGPAPGLAAAVAEEVAHARDRPTRMLRYLQARLRAFKGARELYYRDGAREGAVVVTKEGRAAVREAIDYLERRQARRGPGQPFDGANQPGLVLAARDHALDLGESGATGHAGRDGSRPAERVERYGEWGVSTGENIWFGSARAAAIDVVADLIVDDGVPSRGHRVSARRRRRPRGGAETDRAGQDNIFAEKFNVVGVDLAAHAVYGLVVVMELAGAFEGDAGAIRAWRSRITPGSTKAGRRQAPEEATHWDLGMCGGCGESINGGSVISTADGRKWHKACFRCAACDAALAGGEYFERDGSVFCRPDYYRRFRQVCSKCGKVIEGTTVQALGRAFHAECFSCARCGKVIKGTKFKTLCDEAAGEKRAFCSDRCANAPPRPFQQRTAGRKANPRAKAGPGPPPKGRLKPGGLKAAQRSLADLSLEYGALER